MNWFKKLAINCARTGKLSEPPKPGERITAAAVCAGGFIFTGRMHMFAVMKAIKSGFLAFDDDTQKYYCPRGGPAHLDLFVTDRGTILDRDEAQKYFGISISENMTHQRTPTAAEKKRVKEILKAACSNKWNKLTNIKQSIPFPLFS